MNASPTPASSTSSPQSSTRPFQKTADLPPNYLHLGYTSQVLWVDKGGTTSFLSPDGTTTYSTLDRDFTQIAVSTDASPVVYSFDSTTTSGGGIEKPTIKIDLVASSLSGSQLWRTHLQTAPFDPDSCDVTEPDCGAKQHGGDISVTTDNKWLVIRTEFDRDLVVSTANHTVQRRKLGQYSVEGNWITSDDTANYEDVVRVVSPESGKIRATLTSSHGDERPGGLELIKGEQQQLMRDGDTLIVAYGDGLWNLKVSTGQVTRLWHDTKGGANILQMQYDQASGNVLLSIGYQGTGEVDQVDLFNVNEGKIRWTQPKATGICAIDDRTAAVTANHQTALLDASTGKQTSFSRDFGECDRRLVNGPWYYEESVYRLLP